MGSSDLKCIPEKFGPDNNNLSIFFSTLRFPIGLPRTPDRKI